MATTEPVTLDPGQIQFYDYFKPTLAGGAYRLKVEQVVDRSGIDQSNAAALSETFTSERIFEVAAPRFLLGPGDVHAVYPPGNSAGNFEHHLPHIVLRRRTLPWERELRLNQEPPEPWLALLLFDEDDALPERQRRSLDELLNPGEANVVSPTLTPETMDAEVSHLFTIDVPESAFRRIAPTLEELPLLAHVRQVRTDDKELLGLAEDGWFAVVIGNRLPRPGQRNTVHLVSLEGWRASLAPTKANRPSGAATFNQTFRLVSLASWSFWTNASRGTFSELMSDLDRGLLRYRPPEQAHLASTNGTANTPEEPDPDDAAVILRPALHAGYVPLNYETRLAEMSVGWYRGPFTPVQVGRVANDPFASAEAALIYDPRTGLFDASYAAAWQIGRLLALSDSSFASEIQNWRQVGHHLLDRILEQLGLADRFADANLLTSLDSIKEKSERLAATDQETEPDLWQERHEELQTLLRGFQQDMQNPKQMSERLFAYMLQELMDSLFVPDDPANGLVAAPIDKRALAAGLATLTDEDKAEIAGLAPGLARAQLIREKMMEKSNGLG